MANSSRKVEIFRTSQDSLSAKGSEGVIELGSAPLFLKENKAPIPLAVSNRVIEPWKRRERKKRLRRLQISVAYRFVNRRL
jgi:hypothetical protein